MRYAVVDAQRGIFYTAALTWRAAALATKHVLDTTVHAVRDEAIESLNPQNFYRLKFPNGNPTFESFTPDDIYRQRRPLARLRVRAAEILLWNESSMRTAYDGLSSLNYDDYLKYPELRNEILEILARQLGSFESAMQQLDLDYAAMKQQHLRSKEMFFKHEPKIGAINTVEDLEIFRAEVYRSAFGVWEQ